MKKFKAFLSASKFNAVLFALVVSLVLSATVGAAYAAVSHLAEKQVEIQRFDIGVTLLENSEAISWRDYVAERNDGTWNEHEGTLLEKMVPSGDDLVYGKAYPEELSVRNSGTIDIYVRATIYTYWVDAQGTKQQKLNPDFINLNILTGNGWVEDTASRTSERTVLMYQNALPAGETTPLFSDSLTISGAIVNGTYDYDGMKFIVEVMIDAEQVRGSDS